MKKQKRMLKRLLVSILLVVLGLMIDLTPYNVILFLMAYLVIGYDIVKKAVKGIFNFRFFDENFLMAIATIGAGLLGDYLEAVAVMIFYQTGELFQSYAVSKSRKNIMALMDIRPDYAVIEKDGQFIHVNPQEVAIGTQIIVSPGEKIPLDGEVIQGDSLVDTSALTGESVPKHIKIGSLVQSGFINLQGVIRIKTTQLFSQSSVSKILDLVENASSKKPQTERFITKFARYYTPFVCLAACVLALMPPFVNLLFLNQNAEWSVWIYRALTFLVISCPCALVISIPLSFFAGIGGASRQGVMVKGANYLETLSRIKTILFDKTGTMTQGVFEVCGIHHTPLEQQKLLELSAHAEAFSSHPIALSIQKAYQGNIDKSRIKDIQEFAGLGVLAQVDDYEVIVGNQKLMNTYHIEAHECHSVGSVVHIAIDREYMGHLIISDVIKPTAKQTISLLKKMGIQNLIMLTGDNQSVADEVAKELNINQVEASLLPTDKVEIVEQIMQKNYKVAFVGDGVNDAPVLMRADVGISMGLGGSDSAIEASDIVLMNDDPLKIVVAIQIAKKTMSIVYQNIYFALGIKLLCLILGAFGIANMWLAIFADVGVMILAVLNAMRSLFVKKGA